MTYGHRIKRIAKQVEDYVNNLSYYGDIIRQKRIFFGSKNNFRYSNAKVKRPFFHVILPAFVTLWFGSRSLIPYLSRSLTDTTEKRLIFGVEIFPKSGRENLEVTIFVWSVLYFSYVFYAIRESLMEFKFIAVLMVGMNSDIQPSDLGLSKINYQKFKKFRGKAFRILRYVTVTITFQAGMVIWIQSIFVNSYAVNLFFACFWSFYILIWTCNACYSAYGMSIFMTVIAYYIQLKQLAINQNMESVNKMCQRLVSPQSARSSTVLPNESANNAIKIMSCHKKQITKQMVLWKFFQVNQRYAQLTREIKDYNRYWSRCLSLIFIIFNIAITYCTYLLFLTNVTIDIYVVYSVTYFTHVSLLVCIIYGCSRVPVNNKLFQGKVLTFYNMAIQSKMFSHRYYMKLDTLTQTLSTNIGFRLANNFLIDTTAFYVVFYNISTFFFLVFSN